MASILANQAVRQDAKQDANKPSPAIASLEKAVQDAKDNVAVMSDDPVISGNTNADLILKQIKAMDEERLAVAAHLMNVFNHAIQVQAGRNEWTARDYKAFIIAMRSIDQIGVSAQEMLQEEAFADEAHN